MENEVGLNHSHQEANKSPLHPLEFVRSFVYKVKAWWTRGIEADQQSLERSNRFVLGLPADATVEEVRAALETVEGQEKFKKAVQMRSSLINGNEGFGGRNGF